MWRYRATPKPPRWPKRPDVLPLNHLLQTDMMPFLVVSFDTTDIPSRLAVLTRLLELGGQRLERGKYLIESETNGNNVYTQLRSMLKDSHLWVMQTWQRPEAHYLAHAV